MCLTARKALDEGESGVTMDWENPETGTHGSLTPMEPFDKAGQTCRKLQIKNFANNLEGGATHIFCRQADGSWLVAK